MLEIFVSTSCSCGCTKGHWLFGEATGWSSGHHKRCEKQRGHAEGRRLGLHQSQCHNRIVSLPPQDPCSSLCCIPPANISGTKGSPMAQPWPGPGLCCLPKKDKSKKGMKRGLRSIGGSRLPQSEGNLGCVEQAVHTLSGREGILLHLWVCLAVPRIALIHKNFGAISMMTASLLSVKGKGTSVTLQFKAAKLKPTFRLEVGNFFLRGQITYFSH